MKQPKAVIASTIILLLLAFPVVLVAKLPFTYSEMDLNSNGILGFSEVMYFAEYNTKEVKEGKKQCTEYYALKDGLPLKVICSEY